MVRIRIFLVSMMVMVACAADVLMAQQNKTSNNNWQLMRGHGILFDSKSCVVYGKEGGLFYISGILKEHDGFSTFSQWINSYYKSGNPQVLPDSFRVKCKILSDASPYKDMCFSVNYQGSEGAFFPAPKDIKLDTTIWQSMTFETKKDWVSNFFYVSMTFHPGMKNYSGQLSLKILLKDLELMYKDSVVMLDAMIDTSSITDTTSTDTTTTVVQRAAGIVPTSSELMRNYPNPFNPVTSIPFVLASEGYVELSVYDILGRRVATLASSRLGAGTHKIAFDGSNLPSGIYVAVLAQDGVRMGSQKMMLQK